MNTKERSQGNEHISEQRVRHVLVPTDFSSCAEQALDYALVLARRQGAAVHLLHVLDPVLEEAGHETAADRSLQAS